MDIYKVFTFEAAHRLPLVADWHKCYQLHGHSYRIEVHISGKVSNDSGWVMDFGEISNKFRPLYERLDHHYLNDIEGLENPTSENIARWIWQRLCSELPGLTRIVVHETPTSGCVYFGDED
jgi:6-pyruvoyltetrahydropterin/6-carboxytetrahydropterin synthase